MNKKVLFGLFAASAMLFATSCSNDELDSAVNNGNTVSFKIALNEAAGSRAISDGKTVNELVWEVYDKNGTKVPGISGKEEAFDNGSKSHTLNLTLAKGQTYTIAFWAQYKDAYITDDLTRIELNYNGVAGNVESRDAFYAYTEPITVNEGNFTHPVTLKRPFAQLNLAVSDLEAFENAGIALNQVEVEVSEVAGNFNIKTGEASGAVPAKFNLVDVLCKEGSENPTLSLKNLIEVAEDVAKNEFDWISMNYLLVNNAEKDNVDVKFTLTTVEHDPVVLTSTNTPVQRNHRTNLIAKLTNIGQFKIVINPIYDGEWNGTLEDDKINGTQYGVKTESGKYYTTLEAAITGGETDIQLAAGNYELKGEQLTSDLVITGTSKDAKINVATNVMSGFNATFSNVTVVTPGTTYTGLQHSGEVTFNDCVIENTYWCYSGEKKTVFNNCTFNQNEVAYNVWTYGSNVDFNDCEFNCVGKSVLIYAEGGNSLETVSFKNCKFIASAPANDGKAAIEIDSSLEPVGNVIIENCTAEGFDLGSNSGNMLYNLKKGEEGVNCNITVAIADGVDYKAGAYEISNANGMFWFANEVNANGNRFSGKTVKLAADIDLKDQLWSPIAQTGKAAFKGVFDGNNKTIKNLHVDERSDNATYTAAGLFGFIDSKWNVEIKNLTIDGAKVYGHHYVGGVVGYMEANNAISGCTVKNASISCVFNTVAEDDGDKAGAIVGYLRGTVNNCQAEDCAIDAIRDAGQLVGAGIEANVTNSTATNVTVSHNDSAAGYDVAKDGQNIGVGELVGSNL